MHVVPLPPLQAPVYERQPAETESEFVAFREWLCGSPRGELRDWVHVSHVTSLPPDELRALAQRWVWEIRANEYLAHARRLGDANLAPLRESVAELARKRVGYAHDMADFLTTELRKHVVMASKTGASLATISELARLARVLEPIVLALQRQAEGLTVVDEGSTEVDWSLLSPAELEYVRQLRAKAKAARANGGRA